MIDFKNKKVLWICIGSVIGIVVITTIILLLVNQSNIKEAEKAEKDRIAQEEQTKKDLEALTIKEAPAASVVVETPAQTETPTVAQPVKTTPSTPTPAPVVPTPVPTPDPTPVVDPKALTIIPRYPGLPEANQPKLQIGGTLSGWYEIDLLDTIFELNYLAIPGTTVTATVEELPRNWFEQLNNNEYRFNEGGDAIVLIELKDADGNIVKTGKCKLFTPRG